MAIIKDIENNQGIVTSYHNIGFVGLFLAGDNAQIRVDSYLSKEVRANRKEPINSTTYDVPYDVIMTALATGNLFVELYEYLHSLPNFIDSEKDLEAMHVKIREEIKIEKEEQARQEQEKHMQNIVGQPQNNFETLTVTSSNVILLKAGTTYKITSNAGDLTASGDSINIAYALKYTHQRQDTSTNVLSNEDVCVITWNGATTDFTQTTFTTYTNQYATDIHRVRIEARTQMGTLDDDLEFYLTEVV